jgi:hypothetical protein
VILTIIPEILRKEKACSAPSVPTVVMAEAASA